MSYTLVDYRGEIVVSARISESKELLELAAALQRRYEKETANGHADIPSLSTADAKSHATDDGPNYCGDSNI